MMSKKSPQLRFEGFTDDWEERKFGEVWKKSSERNLNLEYSPKQVLSVAQMKLNPSNRNEQDDYMKTYNVLHKGDIAFEGNKSKSFAFGRFVLNDLQDGIVSHVFNVYRPICKMDTDFMKVYINNESVMKYLLVKATTKTLMMTTLNTKDIVKQKLNLPSLEEQQKIGSFFKQLDATIALHQRKLDLLKEQKKGYLQKMFPKNGAKVPELRFAGFADDWEDRKLGELASFSKGNGYTKNDLVEFGDPIILYGRLYTKYETVIEKVDTFVNKKDKSIISEGSEVIVPASGESSEDISRASVVGKSGLILGGNLNIIKPVNYIDSIFLALTISNGSQQKEMSKRAQGKSVVHLHNSDLKQVNILYPKLEEQQKIGSFFKQLDNTIVLHQRKLDFLKEQKKGFLQKMFV
ncbi:restriction endonuclease subunit S [Lactococcus cremoris]|uniref:restriction endonuclease subunit S n=1 Tax=Lactococcus lactis subsp. cremoris TaxID=1359 RepID=UPI001C27983F|nr:restriction endonuclease subunit S [Lactococcus cremoris]MBU8904491.1 restriction endonuclease subunit S [Lactococcus cremoris]